MSKESLPKACIIKRGEKYVAGELLDWSSSREQAKVFDISYTEELLELIKFLEKHRLDTDMEMELIEA